MMIQEIYQWFQIQFQQNEIFQGLIGGSLFASALYLLRDVPHRLYQLYTLTFTCELSIYSEDPSFKWVCDWLAHQPYAKTARRLQISTIEGRGFIGRERQEDRWVIAPGDGHHFFWFRKRPMLIKRSIREGGDINGKILKETITIRTFGRNQDLIRKLLIESKALQEGIRIIRVFSWMGDYWSESASKFPRSLDSIVLQEGQLESIAEDLGSFYSSKEWYKERGIPWHRGYLFSGIPGTGKSTLAFVLASHFNRPLYALNLGSCEDDASLMQALQEVPADGILLLEDIDAIQAFEGTEHRRNGDKASEE